MLNTKQMEKLKLLGIVGVLAVAAGVAQAQVTGSLWEGDGSGNADVVPSGTPNVTFTATAINFASGPLYTIGEFLASDGATALTGLGELGNPLDNTHIQLTGNIALTAGVNSFAVGHDDGLRINVTGIGTVLDVPGPTGFTLTPFTITAPSAGVYAFVLDYNECCGPPADLAWQYPNGQPVTGNVPEVGSTLVLLGLGLTGLTTLRKRQ